VTTKPEVFEELRTKLLDVETLAKHPELAAKLAELMPAEPEDVRAVFSSKRIKIEDSEITAVLDIVRQVI
jgi:DNA-directed RNA polymerase subunit F